MTAHLSRAIADTHLRRLLPLRRLPPLSIAAAALVLAAAACAPGTTAGSAPPIEFGYQATIWGAPAMVADKAGTWGSSGPQVQMRALSSGAEVRDGILGGSLQAGSLGSTPFIVGAAKGQLVAVAVVAYAGKTDAVVVGKNSPITTIGALKGKKIGSQSGSVTNQIFVSDIGKKAGLAKSDYNLVNTKFQDMYSALVSGQIDAFAGVDPFPQLAVYNHAGRILTSYDPYDRTPLYLCFTRQFVKQHPQEVVTFLEGWLKVDQKFTSAPSSVTDAVYGTFAAKGTTVPKQVIAQSISDMDITPNFRPDDDQYLTSQAQSLIKQGAISSVPNWNEAINTSFLKQAQKAVGFSGASS